MRARRGDPQGGGAWSWHVFDVAAIVAALLVLVILPAAASAALPIDSGSPAAGRHAGTVATVRNAGRQSPGNG